MAEEEKKEDLVKPDVKQSEEKPDVKQSEEKEVSPKPVKEKTTKGMTNLILEQIRSLIEINVALNTKVKDLGNKVETSEKNVKKLNDQVSSFTDRITSIETNMEKFIGLYEMVTNKYNPFLVEDEQEIFREKKSNDIYEGIDIEKLKQDAKNIINDLKRSNVTSEENTDEVTKTIDKTKSTVPQDIKYPEEDLVKEKPNIDDFGTYSNNKKPEELLESEDDNLKKLSSEYHFVLNNGKLILSIPELLESLDEMDDNTFSHHVNDSKNDFYDWIKHSLDSKFAEKIKDEKTRQGLKEKLKQHIIQIKTQNSN